MKPAGRRESSRTLRRKTLCIDLRWIDASGVGVYIKGIMPGVVKDLAETVLVALGPAQRLKEFAWSSAENVRILDCTAGRYSLAEQFQLPLRIPTETDLFFSPYYTVPLLYRGPLAVTVHDMSHLVVEEIAGNWKKRRYAEAMYRAIRKRAALILTVSDFSRSELLRLTGPGRRAEMVTTHLGVADQWREAARTPATRNRPYLIHVGNVKPYKNLPRLVEAFLSVREQIPHDLVIVGQSEGLITGESPRFFETVRAAGSRIELTGFISQAELMSLVGHADALVMPSLYEGFGLPPLEAMAAGVPVAVARSASLPEVCGDAALYFNPLSIEDIAAKLVSIAVDDQLRRSLVCKGLDHSRSFTWERCAGATSFALRQALQIESCPPDPATPERRPAGFPAFDAVNK